MKILKIKSKENGVSLPNDVTEYLASELSENVRQLMSGLMGVTARSSLLGAPINLHLARNVVKNIVTKRKSITIDVIKKLVSKHYGISIDDMVSRSRKRCFVKPRQMAMYLSRKYTDQSLESIGRSFKRYHATTLHSIGAIERDLKSNISVQKQMDILCRKIEMGQF
jgi:chromosomal replication initiator protein